MSGFEVGKAEGNPQVFEIAASELSVLFEAPLSRMEENTHTFPAFMFCGLQDLADGRAGQ